VVAESLANAGIETVKMTRRMSSKKMAQWCGESLATTFRSDGRTFGRSAWAFSE
jgi:hypothetical protein